MAQEEIIMTNQAQAEQTRFEIIVNGRKRIETRPVLTFRDVVTLAFNPPPSAANSEITATYRNGPRENPKGIMNSADDTVHIADGMIFNVTATDKS